MTHGILEPFQNADQAWAALEEQQGMSDGEVIDLWQHQLQTAEQLRRQGAEDDLIVAGLLHDLGDGRVAESDHASWAAQLVRPLFGERIAWVIGAHADAKRYLCTTDQEYWSTLSPVSQQTMIRQGGLMNQEEVAAFAANPWAEDALLLRKCDDAGKNPEYEVTNIEFFRATLQRVAALRLADKSRSHE
ncbi:HD domain-containing protein [Ktedonospora formicarum]|uniref:Phosphodiesterase n=1 Tax=Ktedonospora formicarum TaxID=2778364 RepID=A0A8J3MMS5_9CHLR|nr:HD domain-containing protein [Ktedonospora formicarum]GHO41952.1 phosphodiesterase [Ktedonospora formicarum]